jgi:hypothetical protein
MASSGDDLWVVIVVGFLCVLRELMHRRRKVKVR